MNKIDDIKTPELDKMRDNLDKSKVLTDFVDWLDENGFRICTKNDFERGLDPQYFPLSLSYECLFARFLGIDLEAVETERRLLLEALRGGAK